MPVFSKACQLAPKLTHPDLGCIQGWVDAEEAGVPSYQDIVGVHDDEDEAYDEQADQFEAAYNFRFEVSSLCLPGGLYNCCSSPWLILLLSRVSPST